MCKDLGALWPGCTIVKLKLHFMQFVGGIGAGAPHASTVVSSGQYRIDCHPFRPCALLSNSTGWSANTGQFNDSSGITTRSAVGFAKLIGTANPSIYRRVCTLRMQYNLKISLIDANGASGQPAHAMTQVTGYTRPFDNTESLLAAPATQDQLDLNVSQPNVRRRFFKGTPRMTNVNAYTSAPADLPMPECRLRGSVWPHRTIEIPWGTYVGNDSSFADSTHNPQDLASLEIGWYSSQPTLNHDDDTQPRYAQFWPYLHGDLIFTCLFKDPLEGLT